MTRQAESRGSRDPLLKWWAADRTTVADLRRRGWDEQGSRGLTLGRLGAGRRGPEGLSACGSWMGTTR